MILFFTAHLLSMLCMFTPLIDALQLHICSHSYLTHLTLYSCLCR